MAAQIALAALLATTGCTNVSTTVTVTITRTVNTDDIQTRLLQRPRAEGQR